MLLPGLAEAAAHRCIAVWVRCRPHHRRHRRRRRQRSRCSTCWRRWRRRRLLLLPGCARMPRWGCVRSSTGGALPGCSSCWRIQLGWRRRVGSACAAATAPAAAAAAAASAACGRWSALLLPRWRRLQPAAAAASARRGSAKQREAAQGARQAAASVRRQRNSEQQTGVASDGTRAPPTPRCKAPHLEPPAAVQLEDPPAGLAGGAPCARRGARQAVQRGRQARGAQKRDHRHRAEAVRGGAHVQHSCMTSSRGAGQGGGQAGIGGGVEECRNCYPPAGVRAKPQAMPMRGLTRGKHAFFSRCRGRAHVVLVACCGVGRRARARRHGAATAPPEE